MIPWGRNQNIRLNDRFFLGGPLSLRGFTMRGAGPHKDGFKYLLYLYLFFSIILCEIFRKRNW